MRPFSRCIACNGELGKVKREEVEDLLPENTAHYFSEFIPCRNCLRVYWKGSHYERMKLIVSRLR